MCERRVRRCLRGREWLLAVLAAALASCDTPDATLPPDPPPPPPVTGLTATATSWDRIVLTWTAPAGIDAPTYFVEHAGGSFKAPGTCTTVREVPPGTTECYRVVVYVKGQWSTPTGPVCATTMPSPVVWAHQAGTPAADVVDGLAVVPGPALLLAHHDAASGDPPSLERYDGDGVLQSSQALAASPRYPVALAADPTGNLYVAGTDPSTLQPDVTKLDPQGDAVWSASLDCGIAAQVAGIAADAAGGTYVLCKAPMAVVALEPGGRKRWELRYLGGTDVGAAVAVAPTGDVYVVGARQAFFGVDEPGTHWLVARVDTQGRLVWTQDGASALDGWSDPWGVWGTSYGATAVAVAPSGAIHVAAYGPPPPCLLGPGDPPCPAPSPVPFLLVFDDAGNARYGGSAGGASIAVDGSGVYAVDHDVLVRVIADGTADLHVPVGTSIARAAAVAEDDAGDLYVAGETLGAFAGATNAGSSDVFLARISRGMADYVAPSPTCP